MNAIASRLAKLESQSAPAIKRDYVRHPRVHYRVIASAMDRLLNLETSTCKRMLTADGALTEIVTLDGIRSDLSDDAIEQFVQRFPVELI